jgi:hypothetical protein
MEMPGDAIEEVNQANENILHALYMVTRDPGLSENGFEEGEVDVEKRMINTGLI